MELVHWVFVLLGIALAVVTQWLLLAPFSLEWRPLREQLAEQITQSAALLQECADSADSRA
ncbi:hypothetical protein [uncultured Variovorax sp.]|uniref:hypothetical protein n=1 Tax=uncultured Variovorax sp. TaxID=114708 RepID=UPI0025DF0689|nr:hypothetical protein [uncultured Variovorax sp.]